ncbi:MAG: hypothetical protein ACHRXM_16645 [Isosphaerales bacterium]
MARRLGFEPPTPHRRLLKVVLLILVTWVPLVLISLWHGHAWGLLREVPLLLDPVTYSRYLFVIPLLELAQVFVEKSLGVQTRHFLDSGLVPAQDRLRFESARAEAISLRGSVVAEVLIAVLALTMSVLSRVVVNFGTSDSSWERLETTITPAGWWNTLVSLPILFFFVLRWAWVFVLWAWFLSRVSRLDLELTPTHPDRAGGLGFLGWSLASFAIVLMAISAVLSGGFAGEILFRGASLNTLKYHVMVFVVLAVVILHAPLLAFTGRLARCRFQALLEFGTLISRHDRAFDEKWVKSETAKQENLLGSPDVASLAEIAQVFEHVDRMQLIPFDKKALVVLVVAALIPMIPLVGTAIPLTEIFSKLAELMV